MQGHAERLTFVEKMRRSCWEVILRREIILPGREIVSSFAGRSSLAGGHPLQEVIICRSTKVVLAEMSFSVGRLQEGHPLKKVIFCRSPSLAGGHLLQEVIYLLQEVILCRRPSLAGGHPLQEVILQEVILGGHLLQEVILCRRPSLTGCHPLLEALHWRFCSLFHVAYCACSHTIKYHEYIHYDQHK